MRRRLFAVLVGAGLVTLSASVYLRAVSPSAVALRALAGKQDSSPSISSQQALINQYCVPCHNQRAKTGGLTLDNVDAANVGDNPALWEKVVQKLQGNLMPPQGRPRPDAAGVQRFPVVSGELTRPGG